VEQNAAPPAPPKLLLDLREVAEVLKVSERTVLRMVKEKKIPFLRVNARRLAFPVRLLSEWVEQQAKAAVSAEQQAKGNAAS
jgi:excisionase family DNA binding protein